MKKAGPITEPALIDSEPITAVGRPTTRLTVATSLPVRLPCMIFRVLCAAGLASDRCPLSGVKRTQLRRAENVANDPKQTLGRLSENATKYGILYHLEHSKLKDCKGQ